LERRREANEAARVLYVGATRAIRRLHWVAAVERNAKGEAKPQAGSLLELLWPAVRGEFETAGAMTTEDAAFGQGFDFAPKLLRLAEPVAVPLPVQHADARLLPLRRLCR
jgi:ATP-dependent exoDNAse (exonuclease V) beta subunit